MKKVIVWLLFIRLMLSFNTSSAQAINLTGHYASDMDGVNGAYYVRQIGNEVFWFGEDFKSRWSHVFKGTINGNTLTGTIWDVPKAELYNTGTCTYSITNEGKTLTKTSGEIGAILMQRSSKEAMTFLLPAVPMRRYSRAATGNRLNGRWDCNDGASTYIRQIGETIIFFSEHKTVSQLQSPHWGGISQIDFSNIFIGTLTKDIIRGNWVDVPKGGHLGQGTMTLRVVNQGRLERVGDAKIGRAHV